jgi:uncharacterized glyoxalase superfamily protein PhnB
MSNQRMSDDLIEPWSNSERRRAYLRETAIVSRATAAADEAREARRRAAAEAAKRERELKWAPFAARRGQVTDEETAANPVSTAP